MLGPNIEISINGFIISLALKLENCALSLLSSVGNRSINGATKITLKLMKYFNQKLFKLCLEPVKICPIYISILVVG